MSDDIDYRLHLEECEGRAAEYLEIINTLQLELAAYKILFSEASARFDAFKRQGFWVTLNHNRTGWLIQRDCSVQGKEDILSVDGKSLWPTAQQAVMAAIKAGWMKPKTE